MNIDDIFEDEQIKPRVLLRESISTLDFNLINTSKALHVLQETGGLGEAG